MIHNLMQEAVDALNTAYGTKGRYILVESGEMFAIHKAQGKLWANETGWMDECRLLAFVDGAISAIDTIARRARKTREHDLTTQLRSSLMAH